MSLTAELLEAFESHIEALELVPSHGGRFEVFVDGELIFSKLAARRHAQDGEIRKLLQARIEA